MKLLGARGYEILASGAAPLYRWKENPDCVEVSKWAVHYAAFTCFVLGKDTLAAWTFGRNTLVETEFDLRTTLFAFNLFNDIPFEGV